MRMPTVRSYNNGMILKNQKSKFKIKIHCSNKNCYQPLWLEGRLEQEIEAICPFCKIKNSIVLPRRI